MNSLFSFTLKANDCFTHKNLFGFFTRMFIYAKLKTQCIIIIIQRVFHFLKYYFAFFDKDLSIKKYQHLNLKKNQEEFLLIFNFFQNGESPLTNVGVFNSYPNLFKNLGIIKIPFLFDAL